MAFYESMVAIAYGLSGSGSTCRLSVVSDSDSSYWVIRSSEKLLVWFLDHFLSIPFSAELIVLHWTSYLRLCTSCWADYCAFVSIASGCYPNTASLLPLLVYRSLAGDLPTTLSALNRIHVAIDFGLVTDYAPACSFNTTTCFCTKPWPIITTNLPAVSATVLQAWPQTDPFLNIGTT